MCYWYTIHYTYFLRSFLWNGVEKQYSVVTRRRWIWSFLIKYSIKCDLISTVSALLFYMVAEHPINAPNEKALSGEFKRPVFRFDSDGYSLHNTWTLTSALEISVSSPATSEDKRQGWQAWTELQGSYFHSCPVECTSSTDGRVREI